MHWPCAIRCLPGRKSGSHNQDMPQFLPFLRRLVGLGHSGTSAEFPAEVLRSIRHLERRVRKSAEWRRLQSKLPAYRDIVFGDPYGPGKFLHTDYWLRINVERVVQLGLQERTGLKILDVGSGPALFVFICDLCGHDAVGLDVPLAKARPDEALVYSVLPEALGVSTIRERIEALVPMNGDETYDLITAFMICFNRHKQPDEWQRPAWEFFLRDVAGHLRPGGRLHLRFNPHDERYGELRYWSGDLLALFQQLGTVDAEGGVMMTRERIAAFLDVPPATEMTPAYGSDATARSELATRERHEGSLERSAGGNRGEAAAPSA